MPGVSAIAQKRLSSWQAPLGRLPASVSPRRPHTRESQERGRSPDFELRALRTAEPFSADDTRRHSLRNLAYRVGAELVADTVVAVDADRYALRPAEAGMLSCDSLVPAVGVRHRTAFSLAITFTGDESTVAYNGLLADLEEHWSHSVAFVAPPGITWTLPLYALAIMTSRAVRSVGIDDARMPSSPPRRPRSRCSGIAPARLSASCSSAPA
jgi:sulfide:quinone oxidoreductase